MLTKTHNVMLVVVAHTSNPSYLGDRDWENLSLRPAQAKS
jgi:hypothetical protein